MTHWIVTGLGLVGWVWLIRQITSRDGYLDKDPRRPVVVVRRPRCECRSGMRCAFCLMREGKL